MKTKQPLFSEKELHKLQRSTFGYFLNETNQANGLVPDSTRKGSHSSIAAIGFALAAYPIGVERSFITRAEAARRTLTTLRFFWNSPQGPEADATGYKGFYYHFLDMKEGRRAWKCELSTIDSTYLLAGALTCAAYFDSDKPAEREIRSLADEMYRRADWQWALNGGATVAMGWKPESGFLRYRWQGYSEALLLYVLGLGSPTHPLPAKSYRAWAETYQWKKLYGHEFLYAGPLFIHQLSHLWIDFRGIQDELMRGKGIDYFENSRRATYVQQQYAVRNPKRFDGKNDLVMSSTGCAVTYCYVLVLPSTAPGRSPGSTDPQYSLRFRGAGNRERLPERPRGRQKRISRGKKFLASSKRLFHLGADDFGSRLSAVRSALYLLFSEGYHGASAESSAVRMELCSEAIRLILLLLEHCSGRDTGNQRARGDDAPPCGATPGPPRRGGDLSALADQNRLRAGMSA